MRDACQFTGNTRQMAKRHGTIPPGKAAHIMKAIKAAGYNNARIINYPDGRFEIIGQVTPLSSPQSSLSPFEQWEAENEDTS